MMEFLGNLKGTGTENLMSTNSTSLGIQDLTTGISQDGMESYKESLRAELLISSQEKIKNLAEVEAALNKGWQGVALDRFKKQMSTTAQKICEDLDAEYKDLEARLTDLQSAYFNADNNLMEE